MYVGIIVRGVFWLLWLNVSEIKCFSSGYMFAELRNLQTHRGAASQQGLVGEIIWGAQDKVQWSCLVPLIPLWCSTYVSWNWGVYLWYKVILFWSADFWMWEICFSTHDTEPKGTVVFWIWQGTPPTPPQYLAVLKGWTRSLIRSHGSLWGAQK